jgi:hypothetical protein
VPCGELEAGSGKLEAANECSIIPLMAHRFTVGVEEEFQIVDPQTWELR